jgi:putative membrane protein
MTLAAVVVIGLVAALHTWFMVLEMFLWTRPAGRKAFGLEAEFAATTRTLAANQGLYNGFLAAGLAWGAFLIANGRDSWGVATFFLVCVIVAGVYGAITVSRKILMVQALPAIVGLLLVVFASRP